MCMCCRAPLIPGLGAIRCGAEFEELERGLTRMDVGLCRSQLVDLMNALDEDGDGRWGHMLRAHLPSPA